MFGINEYELGAAISVTVFVSWIVGLICFELWTHVWAWVDESKVGRNWLIKKFEKVNEKNGEWIYPIYYSSISGLKGYAKDKKFDGSTDMSLNHGTDYIYDHEKKTSHNNNIAHWVAGTSASPFAILIGFKIYPVTVATVAMVLIAYLSRFTRRLNKKYNAHAADKSVHVKPKKTK